MRHALSTLALALFIWTAAAAPSPVEARKIERLIAAVEQLGSDFIRLCGSRSSVSGKPYEILFDDGRRSTSEAFLRARLKELQSSYDH